MLRVILNKDMSWKKMDKSQDAIIHALETKEMNETGWLNFVSPDLRQRICGGLGAGIHSLEEIRLRIARPLILRFGETELTFDQDNRLTADLQRGCLLERAELDRNLEIITQGSLYAWENEFKNGYLTIPGGHRVGFVGRGVLDRGEIRTLKDISGLNYRLGHEIIGCADELLPLLVNANHVFPTLIISPPQCGKTTLLRDLIRQFSDGVEKIGFSGVNVGLVDERSEIAGTFAGYPQFKIGRRTDVLDACPKAQGLIMLIRSMSPRVVATDEIGKAEDLEAIHAALHSGVSVVTTIHGSNLDEIKKRSFFNRMLRERIFERIILLSRRNGPGTVEAVYDGDQFERMR